MCALSDEAASDGPQSGAQILAPSKNGIARVWVPPTGTATFGCEVVSAGVMGGLDLSNFPGTIVGLSQAGSADHAYGSRMVS